MKKFFIISMLLLSVNIFAQNSKEVRVDSLSILNPTNGHKIYNTVKPIKVGEVLDSLNSIYKTDKFTILTYFSNGVVRQCRAKRKDPYKKIIL